MRLHDQRCSNCNARTNAALCASCEQDHILEQAQLAVEPPRGLRCFE